MEEDSKMVTRREFLRRYLLYTLGGVALASCGGEPTVRPSVPQPTQAPTDVPPTAVPTLAPTLVAP